MKGNKALFNQKRFEWLVQERNSYLNKLSIKKSVEIMEGIMDFADELRANFLPDSPLCIKFGLNHKHGNKISRSICKSN
ncbi:hypothetical protein A2Y85_03225 [candidate division WOR-3 bacterium RBG_13_43_14]|uniref:Uncharacterized protein n=1 Tax=candidate division WOR-3 bacterium RBG_13_43_14 TaxID=1802590 RepID=A0A1F4U1X7_UNCW3|nr:MAG: hypothetical protein A2Y85_03225 [candidate division WOR-3 bacterium RBG_13_43_14]